MKKLLLTILLTLISTSAMAEWTAIGKSDNFTKYADKASISRKGNIARLWVLLDFKSTQDAGAGTFLSLVEYEEIDCTNKMVNLLHANYYSENMGKGNLVNFIKIVDKEWDYIAPNTLNAKSWKTACGMK